MHRRKRRQQRGGSGYRPALMYRPKRTKQKGGILPLVAAIPALIAVGKAVGGAASYGGQKAMQAIFKKAKKRRR